MKYSRMLATFALALLTPAPLFAQTMWDVDPAHSKVGFRVKHLGLTWVNGSIGEWTAELRYDPEHPESSSVTARLKTASVTTENARRDADLRGNYFAADSFPELSFVSRKVEPAGTGHLRITGDLTIRGITRPVVLDAELGGILNNARGTRVAFSATTLISRREFGMLRNPVIEGVGLVGDEVRISIDLEAGLANP